MFINDATKLLQLRAILLVEIRDFHINAERGRAAMQVVGRQRKQLGRRHHDRFGFYPNAEQLRFHDLYDLRLQRATYPPVPAREMSLVVAIEQRRERTSTVEMLDREKAQPSGAYLPPDRASIGKGSHSRRYRPADSRPRTVTVS